MSTEFAHVGGRTTSKIETLYGTTPAEVFESGLANLADIEAVATSSASLPWRVRAERGVALRRYGSGWTAY